MIFSPVRFCLILFVKGKLTELESSFVVAADFD